MKLIVCILLFSIYTYAQTESLDNEFSEALNQQLKKVKSACEENKNIDQRIADIKEGIDNLGILTKKYLPQENRLSIRNNILLSKIDNILFSGMVFRGEFTKQAVQEDNIAHNFIRYYKFMYNLGDSVDMQDFKEQWAKDIAQGLSCLYPK